MFQQEVEKGQIPVRKTFRGLLDFLSTQPMSDSDCPGQVLVPTTVHSDRSFLIGLDDGSLLGAFLDQSSTWFPSLVQGEEPSWPEATGPTNVIPYSVSLLLAAQFVRLFGGRAFEPVNGNCQLEISVLSRPPKELLSRGIWRGTIGWLPSMFLLTLSHSYSTGSRSWR